MEPSTFYYAAVATLGGVLVLGSIVAAAFLMFLDRHAAVVIAAGGLTILTYVALS